MKQKLHQRMIFFLPLALLITITGCYPTPTLEPTAIPSIVSSQVPSPIPTLIPASPTPTQPNLKIVIEVMDAEETPINRAAVRVSFSDQLEGQAGWTDENGSIRFEDISSFPLSISIQAPGYVSHKSYLEALPGMSAVRITLDHDPQYVDTCAPEDVYATARYMKMDLYNSIDYQPDIVVFGSSRAYTISPQYIEQLTGYRAFNMALNFGSTLDTYYYARYVFSHQTDHSPKLLLVEAQLNTVNQTTLSGVTPIELWPLLPDEEIFQPEIDLCDHVFDQDVYQKYLDGVSSSGGLLWVFQPDGKAVHRPINYRQYRIAVERQVPSLRERAQCESISSVGLEYIKKLVDLANQYNASVVFFRTPFQGDLYYMLRPDSRYDKCSGLLNDFMSTLVSENKHVYFQDFSGYEPIITLDFNGFYDGQHFTPQASNQIIDLLLQDIQTAIGQ